MHFLLTLLLGMSFLACSDSDHSEGYSSTQPPAPKSLESSPPSPPSLD